MKSIQSPKRVQSIEVQREIMDKIFNKLKLKTLEDWNKITVKTLRKNEGAQILQKYNDNISKLLTTNYPYYPWQKTRKKPRNYWESKQNQINFMEKLRRNLKVNEELKDLSIKRIIDEGGTGLLKVYNNNYRMLLASLYPHSHWQFTNKKPAGFWPLLNRTSDQANNYRDQNRDDHPVNNINSNHIFNHHDLKIVNNNNNNNNDNDNDNNNNDNNNDSKREIISTFVGRFLSKQIEQITKRNQMINDTTHQSKSDRPLTNEILAKVYPDLFTVKFSSDHSPIPSKLLSHLQYKYCIQKKADWYRIGSNDSKNLLKLLRVIYPFEHWEKSEFQFRSKKSNQRILFATLQRIFVNHFVIEGYRDRFSHYEFDILIPSINLIIEYQGVQHYDDLPACFSQVQVYQSRDKSKSLRSSLSAIKTLYIPYWWDLSLPSLLSTILQSKIV